MPLTRRAMVFVLCGMLGSVFAAGCGGGHSNATGFCATIRHGHSAFNATDAAQSAAGLAEFDRVAAAAPAAVAPDLKVVSAVLRTVQTTPKSLTPALVERYFKAIVRIDSYLHRTCGIRIPGRPTI